MDIKEGFFYKVLLSLFLLFFLSKIFILFFKNFFDKFNYDNSTTSEIDLDAEIKKMQVKLKKSYPTQEALSSAQQKKSSGGLSKIKKIENMYEQALNKEEGDRHDIEKVHKMFKDAQWGDGPSFRLIADSLKNRWNLNVTPDSVSRIFQKNFKRIFPIQSFLYC